MLSRLVLACLAVLWGIGNAEHHHKPQPYSFGYTIKDKESIQHRAEAGDGSGHVKGNYGFIDNKGIRRQVEYVADHGGFRAKIKTNEPGTSNRSPASVNWISNDPYAQGGGEPYNSRPDVPYVPALDISDGRKGFPTVHDFHAFDPDEKSIPKKKNVGDLIHLLGARYTRPGTIYYGANLVGGRITGFDSRFSNA